MNPFKQRLTERLKIMGGQYAPSRTDRESPEVESLLLFEFERLALADSEEQQPW